MSPDLVIEPMTEDLLLWRCLHFGPLSCQSMDEWPENVELDWEKFRARNLPLLKKLTRAYGACAILARKGDDVVGQLRFYPKVIWDMEKEGELCLQQDYPNGPSDGLADQEFPPLTRIEDKTLTIHCLMAGSSLAKENPYQRKGLGTRLVRALIQWAGERGWDHIRVDAFEDIPVIYEGTGSAGRRFWEKLGFVLEDRHPHPYLQESSEFLDKLLEQAVACGIPKEKARDRLVMRLDLT